MELSEKHQLRELLCELGVAIQQHVITHRVGVSSEQLSQVSAETESDTIYLIDKYSEEALLEWFSKNWPEHLPVEVVAEGLEDHAPVTFPESTPIQDTRFKLIIDPIDGTREIMYDKRSAWVLAGVAPQKFDETRLSDIEAAMMTELPVTKQRLADQISGFRGCGRAGLVAIRHDLESGGSEPFPLYPSAANRIDHGIAGLVKFFPEGKELISRFECDLWKQLGMYGEAKSPVVFDDQYISTGGQMYELMTGHYRFYGDLRPEALRSLGLGHSLTCHPYDVAAGILLKEAGCHYESPWGGEVVAPLDTVTPVSWVCYANSDLAELIRPVLLFKMKEYFSSAQ
ncbi:MAG: inositol monophosphatase [Verrucomicrobia bacterium]|nr:inositol monophosphatase [Verrucomicrobiota bacterium]